MADLERLIDKAIANVTVEDWRKCIRHFEGFQNEDYKIECPRDWAMVIRVMEESSEDSESSSNCRVL